ncbi:MAG: hypothetical protein KDD37_04660 [Bdellovibrionales bacterium]|nr:hypothetical protein [Bdellovibrionales bacterium]
MKSQIKILGSLLVSTLLVSTYQNCSEIDSLQSKSNNKSIVKFKNVAESAPQIVVTQSEAQAASQAGVSPIGNPNDTNPEPKIIVTNSNLQTQSEIQRQRDVSAGYLDSSGNPIPPVPTSSSTTGCSCDQYTIGTGEVSLVAGEGVSPDVIPQILNISTQYACSVAITDPTEENPNATNIQEVLTGALTYFKCRGTNGLTVFDPNVPHFGYRAPNGCEDSGRPIQTDSSMSCRHQADTHEPYGELSSQEWEVFAANFGLNSSNGLPDNNPLPAPTCRDHYNLYWAIALGTGENPTYFPDVSFDCRRIYFAAANGGEGCYSDLVNMAGGAQNTDPQGSEYCPIPDHFNCQPSASGCSN